MLDLRTNPSARELRWFGAMVLLFSVLLSGIVYWHTGSNGAVITIVSIGAGLCIVFYALRPLRLPIYRCWMRLFHPIGWMVSHLILVSIYYLVLTPIGGVLRLVMYDPLQRRFDSTADSYWSARAPEERSDRYFRQF